MSFHKPCSFMQTLPVLSSSLAFSLSIFSLWQIKKSGWLTSCDLEQLQLWTWFIVRRQTDLSQPHCTNMILVIRCLELYFYTNNTCRIGICMRVCLVDMWETNYLDRCERIFYSTIFIPKLDYNSNSAHFMATFSMSQQHGVHLV